MEVSVNKLFEFSYYKLLDQLSGGSRIFPRGGTNSQNCYYFSHFCRKLHENERIRTPGGGARPWRPPLDPPMQLQCKVTNGTILSLPEIWQVRNLRSYTNIIHPKPQVCTKSYAESLKFGKIDISDITSGFRSTEIISQ